MTGRSARRLVAKREVRELATQVFGSKEEARRWLEAPALALDQRRPVELLATAVGRRTVHDLLVQLEYCVYV